MGLDDIWDKIVEEFEYFISFEWISEIGEFFSGFFENLGEISIAGIIFGIAGIILTSLVLKKLDWIQNLSGVRAIFWKGLWYVISFILTYIMVKRAWDM